MIVQLGICGYGNHPCLQASSSEFELLHTCMTFLQGQVGSHGNILSDFVQFLLELCVGLFQLPDHLMVG